LPYANCYVCNKSGHLAGNCPESSKGLYPNGGSCRLCGKVDHYAADCPSIQAKKEQASDDESVTIDQFLDDPKKAEDETEKKVQKPKRKVVNF
jgi:zinc finger CCHC domain-containing protein 9